MGGMGGGIGGGIGGGFGQPMPAQPMIAQPSLNLTPCLSSGANAGPLFEQYWMSTQASTQILLQLSNQMNPEGLTENLKGRGVHNIASQVMGMGCLKAYYMAEAVPSNEALMVEINVQGSQLQAIFKVQSNSPQQLQVWEAYLRQVLVTSRICGP